VHLRSVLQGSQEKFRHILAKYTCELLIRFCRPNAPRQSHSTSNISAAKSLNPFAERVIGMHLLPFRDRESVTAFIVRSDFVDDWPSICKLDHGTREWLTDELKQIVDKRSLAPRFGQSIEEHW
jgi:hypothetical protein